LPGHAGQQQQQQQQQGLGLRGNPFNHLGDKLPRLQAMALTPRQVEDLLDKIAQKGLCKEIDGGRDTARSFGQQPQVRLRRAYTLRGHTHLTKTSDEVKAAPFLSDRDKAMFLGQHKAGAGCLRVRVTGDDPDKLNVHCLVLLTWRLQLEPDLPAELHWLVELVTAEAAAGPAAADGTPSQQLSDVRNLLGAAALNSSQSGSKWQPRGRGRG
jgi:hypothetical protein